MTFAEEPTQPRLGAWRRRGLRFGFHLAPRWAAAWAMVTVVGVAAGVVFLAALVQGVAEVAHAFCQMGVGFFQCTPPGDGARTVLRLAPVPLVAAPFAVAHRTRHHPWPLWGGAGLAAGLAGTLVWWQATGNAVAAVVIGLAAVWLVAANAETLSAFPFRLATGAALGAFAVALGWRSGWIVAVPLIVGPAMALADTVAARLATNEHR